MFFFSKLTSCMYRALKHMSREFSCAVARVEVGIGTSPCEDICNVDAWALECDKEFVLVEINSWV